MEPPVDVLIIGGGFAGLSAAATVSRQAHTVVLFDSGVYRNNSSRIHSLATWDHRHPVEFRASARQEFQRYGTVLVENVTIDKVLKLSDGTFEARGNGRRWVGSKVILATGVEDIFPDIPGYEECWITGIFHCLFCHGWEQNGASSSGILAIGDIAAVPPALHFARQSLRFSQTVTIYTDGNCALAKALDDEITASKDRLRAAGTTEDALPQLHTDAREIGRLAKHEDAATIMMYFKDGSSVVEQFLAHKPKARLRGTLVKQLGLSLVKGLVEVHPPFNQTSVAGVFAAGDVSTAMQTVASALWSGTAVGAGAPLQLQAELLKQQPLF